MRKVPKPDWSEWLNIPEVKAWEACVLSLDIEPHKLEYSRNGWMAGPGNGPIFERESFPTDAAKEEFERRLRILVPNISGPNFSPGTLSLENGAYHGVTLKEFAYWATRKLQWEIPMELRTLADEEQRRRDAEEAQVLAAEAAAEDVEWEDREFQAAFRETVYNDTVIDWRYWVGKMPKLTPAHAARLLSALDPDVFEHLEARPNRNSPERMCKRAKLIERLALMEDLPAMTAQQWLDWADAHSFQIHDGFRLAVEKKQEVSAENSPPSPTEAHARNEGFPQPQQRSRAQDAAILKAITDLGLDPYQLPKNAPGKAGVKAAIKAEMRNHRHIFASDNVFEKAWERLRSSGEIRDKN